MKRFILYMALFAIAVFIFGNSQNNMGQSVPDNTDIVQIVNVSEDNRDAEGERTEEAEPNTVSSVVENTNDSNMSDEGGEDENVVAEGTIKVVNTSDVEKNIVEEETNYSADGIHAPLTAEECQTLIDNSPFYWEPAIQAARAERELRNSGNHEDADFLRAISCVPHSIWIFGNDEHNTDKKINSATDAADGKIPIFVIYNGSKPNKLAWGTGIDNGDSYVLWVGSVADKLKNSNAWIILEPDALALSNGLSEGDRSIRIEEIKRAVETIKDKAPGVKVYIDAGNSTWNPVNVIASYLSRAGIDRADGFSINISSFQFLYEETEYGTKISNLTGGSHFVIDTGRNGKGQADPPTWCNPPGRALGEMPTTDTGNVLVDAFLWVKPPGESDGACNGGPSPGKFWLDYALDLIKEAA